MLSPTLRLSNTVPLAAPVYFGQRCAEKVIADAPIGDLDHAARRTPGRRVWRRIASSCGKVNSPEGRRAPRLGDVAAAALWPRWLVAR